MNNYSEITLLFLKSLRDTMRIDFLPHLQKSAESLSNDYISGRDPVAEKLIELRDEYLKFFVDYEHNKDEAATIEMLDDIFLSDLIDDLRADIFSGIAHELLFKKPEEYTKKQISNYYSFENSSGFSNGMYCSNNIWERFIKNRRFLTNRIKSFPMPPHFIYAYSDPKIDNKGRKYRVEKAYNLFTTDDLYDKMYIEDFYKFEKIIRDSIIAPRNGIFTEKQGKEIIRNPLLDILARSYIERVFGFFGVRYSVNLLEPLDKNANVYPLLGILKMVKSNDMLLSKIDFLNLILFNRRYRYLDLFRATKQSFSSIARLTLHRFIANYKQKYGYDPSKALDNHDEFQMLFNRLSTIYKELVEISDLRRTPISDESPIDTLSSERKALIMMHIADPQNLVFEGGIDDCTTYLSFDRKNI